MKKIIVTVSAAMLLIGCSDEKLFPLEDEYNTGEEPVHLSFTASQAEFGTKAVIGESTSVDGGGKTSIINWVASDKISVFDGAGKNCEFITVDFSKESPDCTFGGTVSAPASDYTAVYPYTAAATISGGVVSGITLPSNQKAVVGSFDTNTALMAARTVEGGRNLQFRNLVAYLKLTTDFESRQIMLCSGSGELLAGDGTVGFDSNGVPSFNLVSGTSSSITLAAESGESLAAGTYYIAVPAGTLAAGWSINITDAEGILHICESANSITFTKSGVVNLGTMSKDRMQEINSKLYNISCESMEYRDPFIYVDKERQAYYWPIVVAGGIKMFKSRDLNTWRDLGKVYTIGGIYSSYVLWAADLYKWKDEVYCISTAVPTTYTDAFTVAKSNTVFKAENPEGSFSPVNEDHVNLIPQAVSQNIDGSLYVDQDGTPWLVYCKEAATEITANGYDAGIYAYQMNDNLSAAVGDPVLLFNGSSSPYACPVDVRPDGMNVYLADAPMLWRDPSSGNLICIWSHYAQKPGDETNKWYAIGQAVSRSGKIEGPWEHLGIINDYDGGHGCIFEDLNGGMKLAYHLNPKLSTNGKPHLVIKDLSLINGTLEKYEYRSLDQTQFKILFCNSSRAYEHNNSGSGELYLGDTYNVRYLIDGIEDKGWYSNFQYWEPFVQSREGVENGTDDYDYGFTDFHAFSGRRCAVSIVIDMQQSYDIFSIGLLNRRPNNAEYTDVKSVEFYVSDDEQFLFTPAAGVEGYDFAEYGNPSKNNWTKVAANEDLGQNSSTQWCDVYEDLLPNRGSRGRYLKIRLLGTYDSGAITRFSLSELYVNELTKINN